jgi:hypothetical protein
LVHSITRHNFETIGLVVSEEKIFEKVYDVRRRMPSDGNSSHDPLGQVS